MPKLQLVQNYVPAQFLHNHYENSPIEYHTAD